jgi:hypothetical protein
VRTEDDINITPVMKCIVLSKETHYFLYCMVVSTAETLSNVVPHPRCMMYQFVVWHASVTFRSGRNSETMQNIDATFLKAFKQPFCISIMCCCM